MYAMRAVVLSILYSLSFVAADNLFGVRDDLHFPLHARATNTDGSRPIYKKPAASIEDRVNDLLPRMTGRRKGPLAVSSPRSHFIGSSNNAHVSPVSKEVSLGG